MLGPAHKHHKVGNCVCQERGANHILGVKRKEEWMLHGVGWYDGFTTWLSSPFLEHGLD